MSEAIDPNKDLMALYQVHYDRIDRLVVDLLSSTGVRYAILIDRKGSVVSHKAAAWAPEPPPLDSVASLVSSNAAATSKLASLLGENAFTEQEHSGDEGTLFVQSVGREYLLTLIYDVSVSKAKVKMKISQVIPQILEEFNKAAVLPQPQFTTSFGSESMDMLDSLLGSGL